MGLPDDAFQSQFVHDTAGPRFETALASALVFALAGGQSGFAAIQDVKHGLLYLAG